MTTPARTPAEHREAAERELDALRGYTAGAPSWHGHALCAIAHTLAAVAVYLEPPPEPDIPGLPAGYGLTVGKAADGEQRWGYTLTVPGCAPASTRHLWKSPGAALAAGLQAADEIAAGDGDGLATRQQAQAWQQSWDPRSGMDDQALRDNGIRG